MVDYSHKNMQVNLLNINCFKSHSVNGKIRWAKLLQIPPNVVFHRKTFAVPYIYNTKTTPLYEACIIK